MKHLQIPVAVLLSLTAMQVRADEHDCIAYLQQDIHNKLVVINNLTGKQVSSSSLCKNEAQSSSSGFSVQYAGVGVGFNEGKALAQAMCDNKFSQADLSSVSTVYQSVVDPSVMQASLECFKLNSKGLHYAVHSDADTHSVTISMTYDGPQSISIKDIVLDGNAKCEGQLYSQWTASTDKKLVLDTKTQALTCIPKDDIKPGATEDISAGTVTIITDAGPVYAQIPRRFAPSLEDQFKQMQAVLVSLQTEVTAHSSLLSKRVLASVIVKKGKIETISEGASLDLASGKLSFPNPEGLKFTPVMSSISPNGQYLTESCYSRTIDNSNLVVWQGAQDTSGRNHPPVDCTIVIVGVGK